METSLPSNYDLYFNSTNEELDGILQEFEQFEVSAAADDKEE